MDPHVERLLAARLAEVTAERDRLAAERDRFRRCMHPWPCPTERAHILAEELNRP